MWVATLFIHKYSSYSLNGLNGDLKAIELYKELSQKICVLMRKDRIEKKTFKEVLDDLNELESNDKNIEDRGL